MRNGKQEKKNKSARVAMAFRRKCIRLIAYIYVFFMVLNRRLSIKRKKWLSVSFCSCVVAAVIVFSVVGQKGTETTGLERAVVRTLASNHNRVTVTGGQTEASIELNRSQVTEDKKEIVSAESGENKDGDTKERTVSKIGQRSNVVAANKPESTSDKQPNMVEAEPELLSPVQALLENNGENRHSETIEIRYQYPTEIGYEQRENYDRVQSVADYIKNIDERKVKEEEAKSTPETSEEPTEGPSGEPTEEPTASSVSQAAIQIEGNSVSDILQTEGDEKKDTEKDAEKDTEKDIVGPVLSFDEEKYLKIQGKDKTIFCTNDNNIQVNASGGTEVEKMCYVYSDKLKSCMAPSQNMQIQLPDNFYGQIMAKCFDTAGNKSDSLSGNFLVENQAPRIRFSQDDFCTVPYTFWVNIEETGHIVSGIRDVKCTVDGKPYEITNLTMLENTLLDEELEVPTQCEFSLPFTEEGKYLVAVTVTDNAGNISTEEQVVQVTKPELISVFMPEKFAIHIDPQRLAGREQIYSDDITLKNDSDFDVQVIVKEIEVSIKDEVSDTGVRKDCNLYMIAPDTGERIPLKKGKNKQVYSYCLKKGAEDSMGKLRFVGETTKESDSMWKDSDVMIRLNLGFSKKG